MADVEACSPPPVDPSRGCTSKPLRTTLLHVVMVTTLFFLIMLTYIYLHRNGDNSYAVTSLVIQTIAYLALGCLYIYNSSGRQEQMISAGYLVFLLLVFLVSSCGGNPFIRVRADFIFGTNIVALSSYCVWRLRSVILHSRLKRIVRTILHVAIVAILLLVIIVLFVTNEPSSSGHYYPNDGYYQNIIIALVAYNAVVCLYICNNSSGWNRKEKMVSVGFLVSVLFVFLLSSFASVDLRLHLLLWANIVAISLYCVVSLFKIYPWLRGCLLDADTAPARARQQEQAAAAAAVVKLQDQEKETPFRITHVPREFSSHEIQSMTQDFRNRIGHGASAQVFRGNLLDDVGTAVAVKRIHMHSGHTEAGEEEFRREVSIIASVHHRSLVRLIGYCLNHGGGGGGGLYLVYPFFENSSLDRWIFSCSDEQRRRLTWPKRLTIAVDMARALAYLHNECHRRILHLDIKPGNILLDGDLRAHVADFGISLSLTRDLSSVINTRGRGTFGYMAPEMLVNAVSDRSDVFSYGMTLLELIGGRRNFDPSTSATMMPDLNLAWKMAQGEHVMEWVDATMAVDGDDVEAVKTVVKVALCCIQHERDRRPSMQNVVDMLQGRVAVDLPPEARRPSSSSVAAVNLAEPYSINVVN